jgi:thymidine kinase
MGYLNIIMGPMYSGKSTELIRIYNKYKLKKKVLVINHKSDSRYGENSINTHNKNNLNCISFDKLADYYTKFTNNLEDIYDIILIDESQFFNDLYDFCKTIVDTTNKTIYAFGLSGDYKRKRFGQLIDLIPIADDIKYLKSVCNKCKDIKNASFTLRICDSNEQILVGANEQYMAVCRDCWLKSN